MSRPFFGTSTPIPFAHRGGAKRWPPERYGLLAAACLSGHMIAPASSSAQSLSVEGPLAGAPAVMKLRLYREGRFSVGLASGMTLRRLDVGPDVAHEEPIVVTGEHGNLVPRPLTVGVLPPEVVGQALVVEGPHDVLRVAFVGGVGARGAGER